MKIQSLENRYGIRLDSQPARNALAAYLRRDRLTVEHLKYLATGTHVKVPVYDKNSGSRAEEVYYKDFDLAATKPPFVPVVEAANHLERTWRHNHGRGSGLKSEVITQAVEDARGKIGEFVKFDPLRHVVIFTSNTSAAMNKITRIAAADPSQFFLLSLLSHHSTQLPARVKGKHVFFRLNSDGTYDLNSIEDVLKAESSTKKVTIFIESESNVTGYKPPIKNVCWLAKKYNARVVIDHAQGASNLLINLQELSGEVFIAMSGHKLYARDGSGAIVGPREFFEGDADEPGGGTIYAVTDREIYFSDPPSNQECGTPAFIAQASLGKAAHLLEEAGLDVIEQTERRLTAELMSGLNKVNGLTILGNPNIDEVDRGPVVSFTLEGNNSLGGKNIPASYIASALSLFSGIGARFGFYCAHPLGYFLGGVDDQCAIMHAAQHAENKIAGCAGLLEDHDLLSTRISFSFISNRVELLKLPDILEEIKAMYNAGGSALEIDYNQGTINFKGTRKDPHEYFNLFQRGHHEPVDNETLTLLKD